MKNSRYCAVLACVTLAASAQAVAAGTANLITNGNFETNTFDGWTVTCSLFSRTGAGRLGAADLNINSGSVYAILNTQSEATIDCDLYQDVAIPFEATAASLTMRYALTGSNLTNGAERRQIDVTTTTGVVLLNIQPSVSRATRRAFAPLAAPVDLTAFAGQTVRIRARVSNTTINSISANVIGLDDVVLNVTTPEPVPTMSEWGMILLCGILLSGALLVLQRRQTPA